MEETPAVSPPRRWLDGLLLGLLLLLAAGLHGWLIARTAVLARDTIGFIDYALKLECQPWPQVFRESLHPPVYPLTVWLVSQPVRHFHGGTSCEAMQLSAQLATALAAVLLVVPMYYLGRAVFDRRVGFWAAALFQCLPTSARTLSDGLAEAVFLLLAVTALLAALWGFRRSSAWLFGLCGLCGGLAYLTRPEGAVLLVAAGLVIVGAQLVPAWRRPWRVSFDALVVLTLAAWAVAGPYMGVIGRLTNKTSTQEIFKAAEGGDQENTARPAGPSRPPLPASIWAAWIPDYLPGVKSGRLGWGAKAVIAELCRGFHYLGGLPALLGLWWFRDKLRREPGLWVGLLACVLHCLALLTLAAVMGYVSERHTLLIVMAGTYWAVAAVIAAGERFSPRPAVTFGLLVALCGYCLPAALKPMHADRVGFREAGRWLAGHARAGDVIVDPFCWAHYYAGHTFWESTRPAAPPGYRPSHFVVIEQSANAHPRLPLITMARTMSAAGKLVFRCPLQPAKPQRGEVQVYRVPPAP